MKLFQGHIFRKPNFTARPNGTLEIPGNSPTSAQRIASLFELSAPGIWDWDTVSGKFVVTDRLREIFGFTAADNVTLETLIDATHPDDRSWATSFTRLQKNSDHHPFKFRISRAGSSQVRWLSSRIWSNTQIVDGATMVAGYSGTVHDITDEVATESALVESEERLRLAIEAGKMAVWEVDLQDGRMTQSPELNILCGFPPDFRVSLSDVRALYNPGELERLEQEKNTVETILERGEGGVEPWRKSTPHVDRTQVQAEVAITTPAGEAKHLMLRAQYALSTHGKPRLTGLLIDITEKKRAEERLAVVARELQHRVKNILSVTGAIAAQTMRGKTDIKEALKEFGARLGALAKANDLILARGSATADLAELIDEITRPYCTGEAKPFLVTVPTMQLQPNAATALGMILHELCTNAVKYGALTVPSGQVSLEGAQTGESGLLLTWQEHNGPAVMPPSRKGFGSRLIETILSGELRGKAEIDFQPDGLRCRLQLHVDR